MNAKEYRLATMPEGATAKEAKAQRQNTARVVVNKTRSRWLTWILSVMTEVQENALRLTDGHNTPGMFELIAGDVAKQFPLGSAAIRIIGFVGELSKDAVQATIDLWSNELVEQDTIGNTESSARQVAFIERGKVLRANKNWIAKARKLGIFSKAQEFRACDYESVLGPMLFASDVLPQEFRARLIAAAEGSEYDSEVHLHRTEQYTLYVSVLDKANKRHAVLGETAEKSNPAILTRINSGETVFAVVEGEIVQFDEIAAAE